MLLIDPKADALRLDDSRGYEKSRLCLQGSDDNEVKIAARIIGPSNKRLSFLNRVASSLPSLSWFTTKIQTDQGTKTVEVNLSSAVKRLKISYFQAIRLCVTNQLSEEIVRRVERVRKRNSLSTFMPKPEKVEAVEAVMEKLEGYGSKPTENGDFVTDENILKHFHEDKRLFYSNKTFYIVDTKELGHGASKTVYKANRIYDEHRENLVLSRITGGVGDFEMYLTGRLRGTSFPKTYEIIPRKEETILIQKECELGDLYRYYFHRKIDMKTLLTIMRDLLTGLAFLHANRICHNDIKQENILLEEIDTEQGRRLHAVLADLGHAYDDNNPHILRQSGGTPGYRSVEKRRSQPIKTHHGIDTGLPSDIWALGVVFYELYRKLPVDQQNKKLRQVLDPFLGTCGFSKDTEDGGYVETCNGFGGRYQSKKPSPGELIGNMLQNKPEDRFTVQEALAMLDAIEKNV